VGIGRQAGTGLGKMPGGRLGIYFDICSVRQARYII
jgi:hypothetical protein